MVEKISFNMSGLIKDPQDLAEIEFWGHDAGEFVVAANKELLVPNFFADLAETAGLPDQGAGQIESETTAPVAVRGIGVKNLDQI